MDLQVVKETHDDLHERLDQFYDDKLMQESRARKNLEYYKGVLMQNLAFEIFTTCDRPVYQNYKPAAFIWLKAGKVWIQFVRELKREKARRGRHQVESLPQNFVTEDFLHQMELRNMIAVIERHLPADKIKLIRLRLQGLSYEEIGRLQGNRSAEATKAEFHRLKQFILALFHRH